MKPVEERASELIQNRLDGNTIDETEPETTSRTAWAEAPAWFEAA